METEDGSHDNHDVLLDVPVEILSSTHFDLIYTHLEVLVDNKVSKLLKTPAFNQKVKAIIVVDEAHLVVDWYVSRISSLTLSLSDDALLSCEQLKAFYFIHFLFGF